MSTVVAIDGPAGSGKSTVAKMLAEQLHLTYVNTGSLYRAVAWAARRRQLPLSPLPKEFISELKLVYRNGELQVNGEIPGAGLRDPEIASGASLVSKQPEVRAALLPVQRQAARDAWIVMEGRDIGTVVFPDAECKFFLTASLAERARRRLAQAGEVAPDATLESVMRDIAQRDEQDASRAIAPLRRADDAIEIITDDLTPDQAVKLMSTYILPHLNAGKAESGGKNE